MLCTKCGQKLKDDQLYCTNCGHVIQIVPDYNPMEDELRNHIGKEDSDFDESIGSEFIDQNKESKRIFFSRRYLIIICSTFLFFLILLIFFITALIEKKRNNSYDYQLQKAFESERDGNYQEALEFSGRALILKPDDYSAKILLAELYTELKDTHNAQIILTELIDLYPDEEDPYKLMISILNEEKNYKKLAVIAGKVNNSKIEKLFDTYLACDPEFSIKEGIYGHQVKLYLISSINAPVYYTLDDTEPSDNSILYEEPILLTEGVTNVNAVTINRFGVYSNIVRKTYTIKYPVPGIPVIRPASGEYVEPIKIEILLPENCEAYYTFDGSIPTKESSKYTGDLDMPEGNQVFSVIVVNEYDMISPVEQRNYKYSP